MCLHLIFIPNNLITELNLLNQQNFLITKNNLL